MVEESTKPEPEDGEDDAHSALNDALNDLEHILDGRSQASRAERGNPDRSGQYSIPLLDDIVVPGGGFYEATGPEPAHGPLPRPGSIENDEECQSVIRRLSNELEVIIDAGVEEALKTANKEIAQRIKRHIDITLPEILDEIAEIKARKGF